MKKALAAMMLLALAPVAEARPIDWQAELDRCRAMREQMEPLNEDLDEPGYVVAAIIDRDCFMDCCALRVV